MWDKDRSAGVVYSGCPGSRSRYATPVSANFLERNELLRNLAKLDFPAFFGPQIITTGSLLLSSNLLT